MKCYIGFCTPTCTEMDSRKFFFFKKYIHNRSYTCTLQGEMPYELWHSTKPSVAHLREFGAPVWILLQGQAEQHKLLPKSKRCTYVGYEYGLKAIKYYTAETRKVLTSCNYRFISPSDMEPSPDTIVVTTNEQRKGEIRETHCPQATFHQQVHPSHYQRTTLET